MILMTKNGAYMHCYNPNEVKRAESKGWTIVQETVKKAKKNANKSSNRR
jgi:hypothetical protein